ncbi:MAG: flagellar basal-body rod protein FlgF [Hyphomicrobiales bacterium]
MENAQIIGLSRQVALQRELDVIANNMANLNTTGFRGETVKFEEFLMPVAEMDSFQRSDRKLSYVLDRGTFHNFDQGSVIPTGNPLDVALQGDGFFVVQAPEGERYTRAGSFVIDNTGTLVTLDGKPVMGEGGPITFGPDDVDIAIAGDGAISVGGELRAKLRLVEFDEPQKLEKVGENMFSGENPTVASTTRVMQGSLEKSNVVPVAELSRMIEVTRTYETVSNLLAKGADLRSKAIERLGTAPA